MSMKEKKCSSKFLFLIECWVFSDAWRVVKPAPNLLTCALECSDELWEEIFKQIFIFGLSCLLLDVLWCVGEL